ncbi:hypothetical protein PpBr36_08009 [Pyricularia pennisetigena]|uniref:hypothetical protein n=1 Tax=Pyricularia pennisetigena TaxID=1578925 RepID=UPI0011533842|nr:hypothetical protein PpBr36_08009 [Pyricularia pennisetigena]TLS24731.1 hypothetical protein PpBr36_08009 [Pyricularia pennisetigena]
MNGDTGLVSCLVERLTTRLPYRTGTWSEDIGQDEIVATTRATLVKLSATSITGVLDALLGLLVELARPYPNVTSHPPHVLLSEIYLFGLVADCCAHHWARHAAPGAALLPRDLTNLPPPQPIPSTLVPRIFDFVRLFFSPLPSDYVLPPKTLLDEAHASLTLSTPTDGKSKPLGSSRVTNVEMSNSELLEAHAPALEVQVRTIIEFVTASNWSASFDCYRAVVYSIRSAAAPGTQGQGGAYHMPNDDERAALVLLRMVAYFWVDSQKLGQVVQELCSSFLHFRKNFQNTVAIVAPLLISRWIDRFPGEFVQLHIAHKRLDGGADTLFDMSHTVVDSGKRRAQLYPLQMSLLFLLPDVFEVASNFREVKGGSLSKKANFLDTLRKSLRNRNEQAAYCLVSLLRVARHFDVESDSTLEAALLSFAMDVQDEVRDAVFRKFPVGSDSSLFDQDILTAALVSLMHLNFDICVESLAHGCLAPSAPQSFKIAVVQTCTHFARLQDGHRYHKLFIGASGFMQNQLAAASSLFTDVLTHDQSMRRRGSEAGAASVNMIINILEFLNVSPMALFAGSSSSDKDERGKFFEDNFEALFLCMVVADESVRRPAVGVARRLFNDDMIVSSLASSKRIESKDYKNKFWRLTSLVLTSMCDIHPGTDLSTNLRSIHSYLESRLLLLSVVKDLAELTEEIPERTAAYTRLETVLLVALCSPDIETCQLVTSCFGRFLEECRAIDAASETGKSSLSLLRNGEVFQEISSRAFRFTGLVAFQKRMRGLLRRMQYPSTGILDAWELGFDKWLHLSKEVSTSSPEGVSERTVAEWRNYSGFLAALGGICIADQAVILEEPVVSGLRWIDRLPSDDEEEPVLARFLRLSVQILACHNVRIRETMREVLSSEVSPALYQPLFKALEVELDVLFAGALEGSVKEQDSEIVFAEQAASLMRALVERLDTPAELGAASSVHLGSLTLNFAKFLDSVSDSPSSLRVKIKICQLCEAITRRKEHLNLRDDVRNRNQLLEFVFGWIARPRTPNLDVLSLHGGGKQDEMARVQKDLDKAALRALAELTFRLPLQPSEGHTDAGTSELKSQMFHTYFNRFLSLLNPEPATIGAGADLGRDEHATSSELAITILSNLLSANIDVGLKHSLSIGYHENVDIRTAFVKVLYNILVQGTEFSNLSDTAVSEKYDKLLNLLTRDTTLAVAMSSSCPSSEVDELTIALLNIFERRGLSFELIEALIKQEVEDTENESELLRRTSVATKMLSVYAKWKGAAYLKATLQKVVERLMLTSKDLNLELDPQRVDHSKEELNKNALQLRIVAKVFIEDICASKANIPDSFRKICSIISNTVTARFHDSKYTAVGAFVFLRFFCPAIVAPEVEGLVNKQPTREMRRGLLLIAKIIQNLANNVLFGAKEPYMFPLNDFLTQNIYKVTTFLREISVAPEHMEPSPPSESFDFGSCVALHRFLYDHWDHVRQRLVSRERRDFAVRSPAADSSMSRVRSPVLEPLRALITNLGPPPLAVTWNRPQISANSPPAYSRFQEFMLRNAFKGSESFITTRVVYDGGESKDGLSIICVILRNIDVEAIDYDTLVYCYLKIASRLWHRPFGLFIDATCYNGQSEPQDELFLKLEKLTPIELSRNLSRIYIYNMNSAFRKCFRRVMRISTKNETSVFNPRNVEYYLMVGLHELQLHFHLSQLHLPKETISVVTDSRYKYQSVTKLSKTKGKIEVAIHVGSQFIQITTAKKQEIYQGYHRLTTTINDIFRLGDIDEAPTSIQTEDDSAFGLRADGGKIVMYFTSPSKVDVIRSILVAKAKYGKDTRSLKSFERLIRPQDVPGTLLNLAMTNLASSDSVLRLASYNLLGALCRAFKFQAASRLMCAKEIAVPLDPSHFIINISKLLARTEPQLTSDFLNEFFVGWDSFSEEQKPLSLAYMSPWLPSLRTAILPAEADGDKGREKIASLFRKLIDVTLNDPNPTLNFTLEQVVWPSIASDEVLMEILLEEIIKMALGVSLRDGQALVLTSIVTSIGTMSLRGKIMARLRKSINRSSLRPSKYLSENAVWPEVCLLLQFCVSLSFDSGVQAQQFLPEVFHVVTMLANTGSADVRLMVHRLLVNTIHAACTSFHLDEAKLNRLRASLEAFSEPKNDFFPHPAHHASTFPRDGASFVSTTQEAGPAMAATESLATQLFEVCAIAAPSTDVCNAWRSRWMSLVASVAFQNNPLIQPRAFTVMGCLAREEVDDDLLYQVLVALRNSVGRFGGDQDGNGSGNSEMMVAIVTSLSKMMAKLPSASRYGLQLFWLAISLLRLVPPNLFNCTAAFLEAVLGNINTSAEVRGERMAPFLLQGRVQLEEAALPLDDAYGVHFTSESFHFAACACLVRGLTDTVTKATALRVLSTFLEMTSWRPPTVQGEQQHPSASDVLCSPYMALILARAGSREEVKDSFWVAGVNPSALERSQQHQGVTTSGGNSNFFRNVRDVAGMKDRDLLLNTAIELVDFQYLEDAMQNRTLRWLNELAAARPGVVVHLYGPIHSILDSVLLHCQNSSTLESAHLLLQTLSGNPRLVSAQQQLEGGAGAAAGILDDILEEMGFEGLWRSCSFNLAVDGRECFALTEKLIELTFHPHT